jgi:hypothetical protein
VGSRLSLFPESPGRRRRAVLVAVVLSLLVHAFGGGLMGWFSRLAPRAPAPRDDAAVAARITIERTMPTPTPIPTATPKPLPTPTPVPRASAAPAVPRLATAPRAVQARTSPPRPVAPHEIARTRPHASPQPRPVASARGTYTSSQLASLDDQFRSTIASAQRGLAEAPAQTGGAGGGSAPTMKRYDAIASGFPADILGGGGLCDNLAEETRGERTYIYWRCRVRYDDGYTEVVAFPWPFIYPRGHTPRPRENFPAQPPPSGFHLPEVFALSRQVCYYFRDRCDAVLARERAAGAPAYGTPP